MLSVDLADDGSAAVTLEVELRPDGATDEFHSGHRFGFGLGWAAGYRRGMHDAETEIAEVWAVLARKVRADAGRPAFAELQRRRGERP